MNDYGTVFRRTIGIDNKGFLIRQFPVVSYRQQRQPFEYLRRGSICILPVDMANPRDMMIKVYKLSEALADKIVATLRGVKMEDIINDSEEAYRKYSYLERANIVRAAAQGIPVVYMNNPENIVPTDNGLIIPLLYLRSKRMRTRNFDYGSDDGCDFEGAPHRKHADEGVSALAAAYNSDEARERYKALVSDYSFGKNEIAITALGHNAVSDSLRAPGDRWTAPIWTPELIMPLDSLAHDLATRWEWCQHMHNKVSEVVSAERTHTSYDSTFTLYF